jgi:hypothetical protein
VLICYQCVGTHPGCGLYDFDSRWYWGKVCPRTDDRCVKVSHRDISLLGATYLCAPVPNRSSSAKAQTLW